MASRSRSFPPRSRLLRDGATRTSEPVGGPPKTSIPPSMSARAVESGIVVAARAVFARRGFVATRVEDLLDEAGVARRTFYRYFTSKEDVLAAVYELAMAELLGAIERASSVADPSIGVRTVIDRYIDFHVEHSDLVRVLFEQSARSDSPLAAHRRRFRTQILRTWARLASTRGATPVEGFTYVALVSALEGVTVELLESDRAAGDVERAKDVVFAVVDRALSTP